MPRNHFRRRTGCDVGTLDRPHRLPARLPRLLHARRHGRERPRRRRSTAATRTRSTRGFICAKVRRFAERALRRGPPALSGDSQGRRRAGRRSTRVTWDEALDHIARRMIEIRARPAPKRSCRSATAARTACSRRTRTTRELFRALRHVAARAHGLRRAHRRGEPGALRQDAGRRLRGLRAREADRAVGREPVGVGHPSRAVHQGSAGRRRAARRRSIRARRRSRARPTCTSRREPGTDLPLALALHRYLFEDGHADEAFLAEHARGADGLRAPRARVDDRARGARRGIDAADLRPASPSSTPRRRPRSSAAAGGSSATATAAAPRRRSWRCRRSAGSSACAAAASR